MRMRLPPKTLNMAVVIPMMACGMAFPLYAASSPLIEIDRTPQCNHAPNLDPQVCKSAGDGVIHYRIDTADGTYAELTLSKEGTLQLQHAGPDQVRVALGPVSARSSQRATPASDMVKQAYHDDILTIDEVRDSQLASTWVINLSSSNSPFLLEMCASTACSSHIQITY